MNSEYTEITVREQMFLENSESYEFPSVYVLDDMGRCLFLTKGSAWQWQTQYWYDQAGNLIREKTTTEWEVLDKLYGYDNCGLPISEQSVEKPYWLPLQYQWSQNGRKVDIKDEHRHRRYYRPDGRLKHKIIGWYTPQSDETFYKWDRNGVLKSTKRKMFFANKRWLIIKEFSASGRLLRENHETVGKKIIFTYQDDAFGNWILREGRTPDGRLTSRISREIKYGTTAFDRPLGVKDIEDELMQINNWMR